MILMILMDAQFWQPLAQPNPTWSPTESILAPTSDHVKWLVICEHGTGKINQEPRHTQSSPGCWWSQRGDWGLLVIRCSKHTCRPSELTKGSLRAPLRCLKSRVLRVVEAGSHTPVPHGLCEQFPQNHGFSTPDMSLVCPLPFVYETVSFCFCISFIFCFICVYEN